MNVENLKVYFVVDIKDDGNSYTVMQCEGRDGIFQDQYQVYTDPEQGDVNNASKCNLMNECHERKSKDESIASNDYTPMDELICKSVHKSVDQTTTQPVHTSLDQTATQPVYTSLDETATQPVYTSLDETATQPVYTSLDQTDTQPIYNSLDPANIEKQSIYSGLDIQDLVQPPREETHYANIPGQENEVRLPQL